MARASSWSRLNAAAARAPAPYQRISICHTVVSPDPAGGPPIRNGVSERLTTQPYGLPTIVERWDPWELGDLPPLTDDEIETFNRVLGIIRRRTATEASEAAGAGAGSYIWRNHPTGPVVARWGQDGVPVVIASLVTQ